MSHQSVTWAMDNAPMLRTDKGRPDTTSRHVLQALAEHADKEGRGARPSLLRLQYRTGYDRRTIQRALRRLEDAGLIKATGTHHDCTVYALAVHLTRPDTDWTELQAEEERQREAAKQRQRRSRARRAAAVTHADTVTVTDSGDVTDPDVTHSDDARHASEERDVTHSASVCHALSAAQTVSEPSTEPSGTSGNGRQASTGSGGARDGGCAARAAKNPVTDEDEEARVRASAVGLVIGLLPRRLRDQLPAPVPRTVQDTIRTELARGLTPDQLVSRAERRWVEHGYEDAVESASGPGLLRPVGVAVALVRQGNCTSPRCDDGIDLDTGAVCRTCEREAEDRKQRREAAQGPIQGAFLTPVPSGPTVTPVPAPRGRMVARDCANAVCPNSYPAPANAPAGLCPECRQRQAAETEAQEVSNG